MEDRRIFQFILRYIGSAECVVCSRVVKEYPVNAGNRQYDRLGGVFARRADHAELNTLLQQYP